MGMRNYIVVEGKEREILKDYPFLGDEINK